MRNFDGRGALGDGTSVDVQLDRSFAVVGSKADRDGPGDDDADEPGAG